MFYIKFYSFWTLYCKYLRLSKQNVKQFVLIEIFLMQITTIISLFSNRIQVVVMFSGSTCGNSPGRFKPAITLHIEQLPPAAKHLVTSKIITKNILNNRGVCIFQSFLFQNLNFYKCDITVARIIFDWAELRLNWSYIFDSHYFIEINLNVCECDDVHIRCDSRVSKDIATLKRPLYISWNVWWNVPLAYDMRLLKHCVSYLFSCYYQMLATSHFPQHWYNIGSTLKNLLVTFH